MADLIITGMSLTGGGMTITLPPASATIADTYFKYTTILLSGDGTNNATNATFVDSSTNNFTITRSGNTTQGTFSPYGDNWSNYFDGTGDYLTVPANSAMAVGTLDFTFEAWIYLSGFNTFQSFVSTRGTDSTSGATDVWCFGVHATGYLYCYSGDFQATGATGAITLNTWHHVAISRSGSSMRLFVNGTQTGSTGTTSQNYTDNTMTFGANNDGSEAIIGYMSNARLVKGTALYTSTFTPSITPLTAIANTSLLTCQSNRLIDNSTNAFNITRNGNVLVQRFSPFGPTAAYSAATTGGSGYFDGSTSSLSVPTSTSFGYGTGDFTIEFWTLWGGTLNSINGGAFIEHRSAVLAEAVVIYLSTAGVFHFYDGPANAEVSSGITISRQWTHVALTRSSGVWRFFINGTLAVSRTNSSDLGSTKPCLIGVSQNGAGTHYNGYISNVRIIKGTAVYTSNFTPPTAPVTAISGTSLLTNFTNAGIYDATMQNNLETVGDAKISTTQSKFGGSSMFFDGTGDYLTMPSSPQYSFGTGDFTVEGWFYINAGSGTNNGALQISSTAGGLQANQTNTIALSSVDSGGLKWSVYYANTYANGSAATAQTWTHVAIVRSSGSLKLYINGTVDATFGTKTDTTNYTGQNIAVGGYFSTTYLWNGYIDDLRITKGYARYTSNFSVPTAALPTQ